MKYVQYSTNGSYTTDIEIYIFTFSIDYSGTYMHCSN